ncbi:MAG: ATP-binding protein [Thermoanaerobaculia bacterium]
MRRPGFAQFRQILLALLMLSVLPCSLSIARKIGGFGHADVLFSPDASGWTVRRVGSSASGTHLQLGDHVMLVNGAPAEKAGDPSSLLAHEAAELTLFRAGQLIKLATTPAPAPWDVSYLFLAAVGAAFLAAAWSALGGFSGRAVPRERLVFAAFSICVALVLILTPAPPIDAAFRASVLVEELARALFPALLLHLVFTFPRRVRRVSARLAYIPAILLLAYTARVYFFPGPADQDAAPLLLKLDTLQALWMGSAALVASLRLVQLSRRPTDLLTEKQIRFLLFGTGFGLLPVLLLNLLPRAFGTTLPVLSSLSIIPLALVPAAYLAALTRYRVWDVEVFGRETAALLGALLLGSGFFTAAQLLLANPISVGVPYAKGILQTTAGLLLALSFVPVRRGLSAALARWQFREGWKDRENLMSLVRALPLLRRLSDVQSLLVDTVRKGLAVSPAALLLLSDDGMLDARWVDGGTPMSLEELPSDCGTRVCRLSRTSFAVNPTPAVSRLRKAGFRTLAPLAVSGRLLALFAVGDRAGRIPLSQEDQELLETVLAPAALALDHARLYEELRSQAEQFKTLKEFHEDVVAGSAAAIAATDSNGVLTSANPAFARLVGLPVASLIGRPAHEVLPEDLFGGLQPRRVEADLGGGPRVLDLSVSPFPGAVEGSLARVYVLQDSTENARLERALVDRERLVALGTLSAGVAHEVNTPLTGVAGYARLLLEETTMNAPHRVLVEKIERQAFRASRLVGSLLDLARGRPRDLIRLDPCDVAREAARALDDEITSRRVTLHLELPSTAPAITGHSDALIQVLVNLVKNGVEASAARPDRNGSQGLVTLRVAAGDEDVLFEVEDDGVGMLREQANRVFEPFYSTKTAQGGTGLGLAIAGDIIRAHGGTLTVDSTPGQGSRFTVSLPRAI